MGVNPLLHQEHIFKAHITKLQFQLAFLAAELEGIIREIFNEDVRGDDLKDRLSYLEEELMFKLEVLNKELESEMARTKMDISSMDVRIEGEYKERLAKLELALSLLINQQSSHEDEGQIMAMIEELKRCLMEERVEVHFYDKLLTPEVERMKMRHTSSSAAL